jgi:antitoxin component of MazEF toxin-antitoxin module
MKLRVRRIGNSLGVIIPKATLDAWGVGEGDSLELSGDRLRPLRQSVPAREALDEHKRKLAVAVVARFTPTFVRRHGLANLRRWKARGTWVSAYDEWKRIFESNDDGELYLAMLGRDERSNRLRRSPPYVGLLPRDDVRKFSEEAP